MMDRVPQLKESDLRSERSSSASTLTLATAVNPTGQGSGSDAAVLKEVLDPTSKWKTFFLGRRYDEAEMAYSDAIRMVTDKMGSSLGKGGKLIEALHTLVLNLSLTYLSAGRPDDALKRADWAVKMHPLGEFSDKDQAWAYHRRGIAMARLGEDLDVTTDLEEAKRLAPAYQQTKRALEVLEEKKTAKGDAACNPSGLVILGFFRETSRGCATCSKHPASGRRIRVARAGKASKALASKCYDA